MTMTLPFPAGNYSYLKGGFQYSAAVIADTGHAIERARFDRPVPLAEGFERIRAHLQSQGRPLTALCACELRSPAPMSEPDFVAFNRAYVRPLADWGLFRDDINPVARCNLVPAVAPPAEAGFHAFSYTVPLASAREVPDFTTSGAAECPDRPGYRDHIVRLGETSPDALADKLRFAIGDLGSRLDLMGVRWTDVMSMSLYTVHDLHHAIEQELAHLGALAGGLAWHWVRPPVEDIEIEIDARRVSRELLLPR
ncbi:hypothetical protein QTH97_23710 [Variovorax sp. J22R24]|uniref:2-amino-5-chloromuconate deaminase CnbZ n=1 Tax=Variovorax gracilis TaxID=3053502 RepID=UPI002576B7DC|nr:hypothetical protein [Variovorax sp. J22R24]MDM0107975.1 hypothetical protein [Variovorax sp. J22R24]